MALPPPSPPLAPAYPLEIDLLAASPTKVASKVEPSTMPDLYKNQPIPFIIMEPAAQTEISQPTPAYNLRVLEKEIPDTDEIKAELSRLKQQIADLQTRVSALEAGSGPGSDPGSD